MRAMQDENVRLREQVDALSKAPAPQPAQLAQVPSCDHLPELASLTQRLTASESALAAATCENEALKERLAEHEIQASKYAQQHTSLVDTLEKFRRQPHTSTAMASVYRDRELFTTAMLMLV